MKIKIKKCSNPMLWYAGLVGTKFHVIEPHDADHWWYLDGLRGIDKDDAEIVPEPTANGKLTAWAEMHEPKPDRWIPMAERKPTDADVPFDLGFYGTNGKWEAYHFRDGVVDLLPNWTHWFPQRKLPPAPPKEPSAEELDRRDAALFLRSLPSESISNQTVLDAFLAGLRHAREQGDAK